MNTWITIPNNSDFTIHNLPYGVFMRDNKPTPGIAIGDSIIDLNAAAKCGLFKSLEFNSNVFESDVLNDFIALWERCVVLSQVIHHHRTYLSR